MTAEMITDNSEETLPEDNSEEIGDEIDDVHGDEEQLLTEGEPSS